ncbi:hypothetical protein BpHYR1_012653 [Brachionus plicatilis]|uniref:Uncharacterized protein n=1 Tax=Brachionus plicatilis TaxID=10195 RepID=A0A3M7SUZ9_BRAPC|nr:hypothetical protein BpHYR1_012653 [Brachionus plicatilis]
MNRRRTIRSSWQLSPTVCCASKTHHLGRPHDLAVFSATNSFDVQFLFLVVSVIEPFLVDDGVDGDSGLASLSVADDQLSLASSDRHQTVHGFDAGLHRFSD